MICKKVEHHLFNGIGSLCNGNRKQKCHITCNSLFENIFSTEINLVKYEKEIGHFFQGTKTPKQTKRGDAFFQIVSKATKHKY